MKKIIVILAILMLSITLCACGNQSLFGNYTFKHIHFFTYTDAYCATIDEWTDASTGIEVLTDEYGSMFLSEGSYIMMESSKDCPFCGDK